MPHDHFCEAGKILGLYLNCLSSWDILVFEPFAKMVEAPQQLLLAAFVLGRPLAVAGQSITQKLTATAPPTSPVYVLPESQMRQSISVIIDLLSEQSPYMVCWYPISVRKHPPPPPVTDTDNAIG
jgi:hypothetical protein